VLHEIVVVRLIGLFQMQILQLGQCVFDDFALLVLRLCAEVLEEPSLDELQGLALAAARIRIRPEPEAAIITFSFLQGLIFSATFLEKRVSRGPRVGLEAQEVLLFELL
jgi:hypothetical protein